MLTETTDQSWPLPEPVATALNNAGDLYVAVRFLSEEKSTGTEIEDDYHVFRCADLVQVQWAVDMA